MVIITLAALSVGRKRPIKALKIVTIQNQYETNLSRQTPPKMT